MPKSMITTKNGLPVLKINEEEILPCGYMSYAIDKADYSGFIASGYKLIFVPVYAGDRGINPMSGIRPFYPGFWVGKDRYDFSAVEENFKKVIADRKPGDIFIIPRVMVEPPSFWEKENPDELCRDFSGKSVHQSYSSDVWFHDTEKAMAALQDFFTQSKLDEYIVGWQIACGWTEEFMRPTIYSLQLTDYSDTSAKAWQSYLKERYADIGALNAKWMTSYRTFDDIAVPSPAERVYFPEGATEYPAPVAEYNRFRSVETANALCVLARSAKKITGGNRVIGAFYGYAGTKFGHDAVDLVLNSPDVDFLASPFAYDTGRAPGTDWVLQGVLGSTRLHGKLWFTECDVRTHLSRPISVAMPRANPIGNTMYDGPIWFGPDSEETSVHQMKKAFVKTMSMGGGSKGGDFGGFGGSSGKSGRADRGDKADKSSEKETTVSTTEMAFSMPTGNTGGMPDGFTGGMPDDSQNGADGTADSDVPQGGAQDGITRPSGSQRPSMDNMQMPSMNGSFGISTAFSGVLSTVIWLVVSVLVLAVGLIVAKVYRY